MELDPKDYDVVKLLTKLKNTNGAYPPDLLTPRRQNYLRRVTEMGLGFGVADGLKTTVRSGNKAGVKSSVTASGLIEAALVLAIVAEAGATAYIYRDRIAEIFGSYTSQPHVVEVTSAPEIDFSPRLPNVVVGDPDESSASPSAIETPSGTPIAPTSAANNNQNDQGGQAVNTPDPNGNNGNHFGQTPKPDRTTEPGGGGNNNDNNNNDNGRGR